MKVKGDPDVVRDADRQGAPRKKKRMVKAAAKGATPTPNRAVAAPGGMGIGFPGVMPGKF